MASRVEFTGVRPISGRFSVRPADRSDKRREAREAPPALLPKKEEATIQDGGQTRRRSKTGIETAVQALKTKVEKFTQRLEFGLEADGTELVVRDRDTGEVVRSFPPEELDGLQQRLEEHAGFLVDLYA